MIDQANKLRDLVIKSKENTTLATSPAEKTEAFEGKLAMAAKVICVTSGKGGVGKTNFCVNLAIQLAKNGKRVVIIDADFGLANIDVLFGVVPKFTIEDVLQGGKNINEVLTPGPMGIQFVAGGSGMSELANLSDSQLNIILENFASLDEIADIVLVDTGAGISNTVTNFVKAAPQTVIITTPEPTSVTDAYAIMKASRSQIDSPDFHIVVNRVDDNKEGLEIFEKLNMVTKRFLDFEINDLGYIPYDNLLIKAVKKQQPVSTCFPNSGYAKSVEHICEKLINENTKANEKNNDGIKSFMKRLINIFGN